MPTIVSISTLFGFLLENFIKCSLFNGFAISIAIFSIDFPKPEHIFNGPK